MTEPIRRPHRLRPGDRVAVVSPSWGGPASFPDIFERGLQVLRDRLGLVAVEFPTARMSDEELRDHPEARAADVNAAFADDSIRGVISSIGGDDSVRILPHLSVGAIIGHPKLLMGYSDFTTLLTYVSLLGNVTFHGPAVMAGLAQLDSLEPSYLQHLLRVLFGKWDRLDYTPYQSYSVGYPDWGVPSNLGRTNPPVPNPGWDWVQKTGTRTGRIWGGCIEVLEFLKGTDYWPHRSFFDDKILFLETSEEAPSPLHVARWLRNYGTQTILDRIQGLVFGRPYGYAEQDKQRLKEAILGIVVGESGRTDIPIVLDFDAGHTDPQLVLPFGTLVEMDSEGCRVSLTEPIFDEA